MAEPSDRAVAVAEEMIAARAAARAVHPHAETGGALSLDEAYRAVAEIRRRRAAAGAPVVGAKIGFSNRAMWPVFGVDAPFWGPLHADTVTELEDVSEVAACPLEGCLEPRVEPEIVFGLAERPQPDDALETLAGRIAWLAFGVELVVSPYPGWRFDAADAIVAHGLHARLIVGPKRSAGPPADLVRDLGRLEGPLSRDGETVEIGRASNVLGHPLDALRHLAALDAPQRPEGERPPLAPGGLVTTGSLTQAHAVAPGETWRMALTPDVATPFAVRFL